MENNLGTIVLRLRALLLWALFILIALAAVLHEDERPPRNDHHPVVYVTAN